MKNIQQYCKVTDRIEHDPACKEEVISMAKRKEIRTRSSRRGFAAGTAIAAALLLVNGGIGYMLFAGSRAQESSTAAMSGIAEQEACYAQPLYAEMMQQYYTAKSGIPCDFDFQRCGRDFNIVHEDDEWRIRLNAITGCDWILYYFYDVEPLAGQTWEEFQSAFPHVELALNRADGSVNERTGLYSTMPNQDMEPDYGLWHCYGVVTNATGRPFSENGLTFDAVFRRNDREEDLGGSYHNSLDFIRPFDQLRETAFPCLYNDDKYAENAPAELNLWSVTPFGVFFTCEPFDSGLQQGWHRTYYSLEQSGVSIDLPADFTLTDDQNNVIDEFGISKDSYYGILAEGETAVAVTFIAFDHPWDPEKGALWIESQTDDGNSVIRIGENTDAVTDADTNEKVQIAPKNPEPDDDGMLYWKDNDSDSTMTFEYEIDMSKADRKQIIDINADQGGVPIRFTAEVKNFSAEILGTVESGQEVKTEQVNSYSIGLEPQDTPVKLVLHLQPYWSGAESFMLNTNFTVHDGSEADAPVQEMRSSVSVHNKERLSGTYTFSLGLFDNPECKETLEQFTCGESDTVLYLDTHTTGHDTAKGETYSIYVKVKQDGEEIPFSLTPDGEKKTMQLIGDLPQGDLAHSVTPVYAALNAKDSDSKVRVEVYFVPDVIPADHKRETAEEGFEYVHFQKAEATIVKGS